MSQREGFGSRFGSILALAGSAVGLGNIWRFPYMLSENGGGAFLLTYILCVLLISIPMMITEFIIGRKSQKTAYGSLAALSSSKVWGAFGMLFVLIPTITVSYYCVIGGWTFEYFFKSLSFAFQSSDAQQIEDMFGNFVSLTWAPLILHFAFLLTTCIITSLGVKKGIEGFSKVMMPALFIMMIIIMIRSVTLPGAMAGVTHLFKPDFSCVTPDMFLAAMGQAFYSLSIGMGILLTFGSYLPHKANLPRTAVSTAMADLVFAIISGAAVIPAMYAFGMQSNQGPGLVFQTLPVVFSQMPAGGVIAIIFFFSVVLAALTSAISLFEVPVGFLIEKFKISRPVSCLITFAITFTLGAFCSLSFGPLSGVTIAGMSIFDICDYIAANYLIPLGGLIAVLFLGWKMKKSDVFEEYTSSSRGGKSAHFFHFVYPVLKYVAPLVVILIFLYGLFGSKLSKDDSYALDSVIEVQGRQGVAADDDYYYVSSSTALYKYSKDGALVQVNDNPFSSLVLEANHFGDIDVYNGEIYTGIEIFIDGVGRNIQVGVYDAQTLEYRYSIPWLSESGQVEVCGLAVDRERGLVWMADWVQGHELYCYDIAAREYVGKVSLNPAPKLQQGIYCLDGKIIISCDDGDADQDEPDHLYICNPYDGNGLSESEVEVSLFRVMDDFRRAGEIEGLCFDGDDLLVLSNRGSRIVLGMVKGFYPGYDREIHELYIYKR